ncbi:MAG: bifunctional folylpolyglutamate synthase/dihydrofolate synthase [Kiritimatiellia bacterium]|jgi:dihydrofolate synthase/folylpolyglutamate synthase
MHQIKPLLDELFTLTRLGIKPGLEVERALLAELGNPEKHLPCIHVAGTNGKGSVCAMLESVLRAAGLRTGLYTSPHLSCFNERIRYTGKYIPDATLAELLPEVMQAGRQLEAGPIGRPATFFEIVTALAFKYFESMRPDIVILETGMGGRLDATNVVIPLAAVITGISLEHTAYLGCTIEEIAKEKCGIIKSGRPVIVGDLPPEAQSVAREMARDRDAPLIEAASSVHVVRRSQSLEGQRIHVETAGGLQLNLRLPLLGRHQLHNAALAIAVLERVFDGNLPESALRQGLEQVQWPARLQVLEQKPPLILDGAHNPAGAAACARALQELLPSHTPLGLIVAQCDDKDLMGLLRPFNGQVRRCWAVPMSNPRSRSPEEIAAAAAALGWKATAVASVPAALTESRAWAEQCQGAVCAVGSLFLAGEILALRQPDGNASAPG